jgi:hypothetical protein
MKSSLLMACLLLLVQLATSLSIMLQKPDWYCFTIEGEPGKNLYVDYVISGLNEDKIEFKVNSY